jgi:tRNA A-37 threonylcarbamoyl transferase component Bud32
MIETPETLKGEAWAARLKGHLAASPNNINEWMAQHTNRVKVDNHSTSGLLQLGDNLHHLKFYAHKSPLRRFLARVYLHRSVQAFEAAAALRWHGIAVPRPRACLKIRGGFLLLTKGIEGSETLEYLWQDGIADDLASNLMSAAGAELAQVHNVGYCHGDCKWSNMLWGGDRLYLIDLDATRRCRVNSEIQAKDLARFTVDAERLDVDAWFYEQFIESYLSTMNCDREDLERRIRPLLKKLRKKHWKRYGSYAKRLA